MIDDDDVERELGPLSPGLTPRFSGSGVASSGEGDKHFSNSPAFRLCS